MAQVFCNSFGNGYCYVDNSAPTQGESITIYCVPFDDSQLIEVQAWTSYDESIAIDPEALEQTITYQSAYRNVYIDAYFTGSTPTPDPPKFVDKYPWLLFKKDFWRMQL